MVGAGRNARSRHIPELRSIPGVEIVGVANSSLESSRSAGSALGVDNVYSSWQELVESPQIDAVLVGTYPDLHEPVSTRALNLGKHVLIEARMARNAVEAERIAACAKAHPELVCQVVPAPLAFEIDPVIREIVNSGRIGELLALNAHMNRSSFLIEPEPEESWRRQRSKVGNNVLEVGILYETTMRWTGSATQVFASAAVHRNQIHDPHTGGNIRTDVPDHLSVLFSFGENGRGAYQFSSITGHAPSPAAYLHGSEGTLRVELLTQRLEIGHPGGDMEAVRFEEARRAQRTTASDFVAAIRGLGEVTRTSPADGLRYMLFVDAVDRSLRDGCAVSVESAGLPRED